MFCHKSICEFSTTVLAVIAGLSLFPTDFVGQTAKTEPQQIRMGLIVTDSSNRSVGNVRKENIQVIEDGQALNVSFFGKDERPLRCVIAIDTSGSFKSLLGVGLNITRFLIGTKKPDDEMMLVTFVSSDKIKTLVDFTTEGPKLIDALKLVVTEGGQSAVVDAAYLAVKAAAKRQADNPGVRAVVVLLTDGEDRSSFYTQEQLVTVLRENDVQVFIIGITGDLDKQESLFNRPNPRKRAEKLLLSLAQETGGRVFFAEKDTELLEATKQIILELNSQYLIGFDRQPQLGEKGIRKVRVSIVNDPQAKNLTAITRPGYRVGPSQPVKDAKSP
ncbi:MAG: Ca-activated chloride channel [Blastocatellia bacterium]|jgi:VWFA-related protein|nr:Ca-activated chloride channel [Blastocatellia bacterium]